jgi:hypothetical protein
MAHSPQFCRSMAAPGTTRTAPTASLMALPEASWLRWSNFKSRNEAQGSKGAEDPYGRWRRHLWPAAPER